MKLTGITYSEQLSPAMTIIDQAEADRYFELLVAYQMGALVASNANIENVRETAARNVRDNLGYYAGYYDAETQARVNRLFNTTHPVFGDMRPTPVESFKKGQDLAKR